MFKHCSSCPEILYITFTSWWLNQRAKTAKIKNGILLIGTLTIRRCAAKNNVIIIAWNIHCHPFLQTVKIFIVITYKGKDRKGKSNYIAPFYTTHSLKALWHGSHSFNCKLHHACISFVSVHQMAPPLLR